MGRSDSEVFDKRQKLISIPMNLKNHIKNKTLTFGVIGWPAASS